MIKVLLGGAVMGNGHTKTLVEEMFDTVPKQEKDIGSFLGPHRVLLWFNPLRNDPTCLLRIISALSRKVDWESFEPGTTPVIAVHSGSIYSFKEFARQHSGTNEADAIVLGTSTEAALEDIISIIESISLEHFIKMERSEEIISKAIFILPFSGILSFDTWIEGKAAESSEYELLDRRHEAIYGLEIKRPRDSIESDLFSCPLDETEAIRLLLKVVARKTHRNMRQTDAVLRCWDLLKYARELQSFGAVNESAMVAVAALEELLIPITGITHEYIKRDRINLGKIISIVERNKKLTPTETHRLRQFGDLRIKCAQAIATNTRSDQDFALELKSFLDWLESYPDFLK